MVRKTEELCAGLMWGVAGKGEEERKCGGAKVRECERGERGMGKRRDGETEAGSAKVRKCEGAKEGSDGATER
jgi:hypothetical protein